LAESVKLIRLPIDTTCEDCDKKLPFGAWGYYHEQTQTAICPDCGTERGWSSKERVNGIIKKLELQEDIKALKKQRKIEADALYLVREQIDLHRLGERDIEVEKQIVDMTNLVQDYLRNCGNSVEERKLFEQVQQSVRDAQDLQKEIRNAVQSRLFLLERFEQERRKKKMLPMEVEENE